MLALRNSALNPISEYNVNQSTLKVARDKMVGNVHHAGRKVPGCVIGIA